MSLSQKQSSLYWRTWSAVCTHMGWKTSDSKRRYALHKEAGCAQSMTEFENRDLDRFLKYCADLTGDQRRWDPERNQMIWRILKDASDVDIGEEYLKKLSYDLYGLGCWRDLSLDDLEKFRNTIHNRAYSINPEDVDFIPGVRKHTEPDFAISASIDIPF